MKYTPEHVVVYVEKTSGEAYLCIARKTGTTKLKVSELVALMIGARYRILVGDAASGLNNGVSGTLPEWFKP